MNHTADVIIIGGGIAGCSTAYYLARSGVTNVIVLEGSDSIGHGGSSRNGGGVRQSGRDVRELPIVMYGIRNLWPYLSEELGVDTEYTQKGNLRLGKTQAHYEKLKKLADNCRASGLDVRMVDGKEVREICPCLSQEITCASWCPTDGHANPLVTTLGFYRKALEMGVRFFTGAKVKGLRKIRGKLREVILEDGTVFETDTVVLSAGYASRYIMRTVGLDVPMISHLEQVFVTEREPKMFDIMLGTADADFYGHQASNGTFVWGSDSGLEIGLDQPLDNVQTYDLSLGATCRAVEGYIPLLKDAKIVRFWGGWLDMTADGTYIMGPAEEVPGLLLACGFNGHGFGTGPAVGYIMAKLAMGEEPPVDIRPLRYDRFMSNK